MKRLFLALALLLWAGSAHAQSGIGGSGIGKNGNSGGAVGNGTSGQIAEYGANGTTVRGASPSGDVTYQLGGAFNIKNGVVTNAKLANSSITLNAHNLALGGSLVLNFADFAGSITAAQMLGLPTGQVYQGDGTGKPAAVSLSASLDAAFGSTVGSFVARCGGSWQLLTPGTAGYVLASNGVGNCPSYQANSAAPNPILYVGTTTNSGNHYTITSPTPATPAFTLTNQYTIRAIVNATNTGASDINVAGTGAIPIKTNTGGGFVALSGGEFQGGNEYDLTYNSTCSCFVKMNDTPAASNFGATSQTITQAQWVAGTDLPVTTAGQTFILPVSTTLSPAGGLLIDALLASTVLTPNAADVIKCGNVALAAGASLTIPLGSMAKVVTDGAGVIGVSPGSCSGGTLVGTVVAGATGQSTYTDGDLLIGNTSTGGLNKAKITAGANCTVTNGSGSITINCTAPGSGAAVNAPQGRLTCTTGTPVMTADVTSCTTIYYDNYIGNAVPFYNGSADSSDTITAGEVSDAVPNSGTGVANSGDLFDLWWSHSGATICHATNGSGGGWASDTGGSTTARGTGYTQLDLTARPYITNKNALTHCYNGATDKGSISANQATFLGTFYTTAAGTTKMQFAPAKASGGSNAFLGLGNAYNGVTYRSRSLDSAADYVYSTATWRAADNSASNRITYVDPVGRVSVEGSYTVLVQTTSGSVSNCAVGLNRNSASAAPDTHVENVPVVSGGSFQPSTALANWPPSIGLNYIQAMENALSGANCSFYLDSNLDINRQFLLGTFNGL